MPLKRVSRVMAVAGITAASAAYVSSARAEPPVPTCHGNSPADARTAKEEGFKHYRLSKREGRADAEMATALSFFDAACAAGDDSALELRAYALAGVERFVEAAQTLDVFLAAHPVDTLSPDVAARVAAQRPAILSEVSSLTVTTDLPGTRVLINHQAVGTTPLVTLRLAPGTYDVEVAPEGGAPIQRVLDLAVGEHTETFSVATASPASAPPAVVSPPRDTSPRTGPESVPAPKYRTATIGSAVAGGALLAAGVVGTIWSTERTSTYDSAGCPAMPTKSGCSSTLSEFNAARDIEIVGYVGAGLGAATALVLYYLDSRRPHSRPESLGRVHVVCGVPGAGVACGGTF